MNAHSPPKRRRSIAASVGTKLTIATIVLMALVSVGVYFAVSRSLTQTLLTAKGEAAQQVGLLFAANLSAAVAFEDQEVIHEGLRDLAKNGDVTFAAVWADGSEEAKDLGRYVRPGHKQRSRVVSVQRPQLTWSPEILSLNVPVLDDSGKIVASALIEFSLAGENTKTEQAKQRVLLTSTGVALAIALLLLIVSRRTVVMPLRRLQAGAKQMERGESATFDIESDDEVGDLANALVQMAGAIREREEEIQHRNRDMRLVMDNVGQGFLTLDQQGIMSDEYSRVVVDWFGKPGQGQKFVTYLERIDPKFAAWFAVAFGQVVEGFLPTELSLAQLPTRLVHEGKTWSVQYRPLLSADSDFERLIVVLSDVTHLLEKTAAERAQQELIAALTCLTRDSHGFLTFLDEAETLLLAIERSQSQHDDSLARHIHTLKGISATMELHSIVECCHELEERQLELPDAVGAELTRELRRRWNKYREGVQPLLASIENDRIQLDLQRYTTFFRALQVGRPRSELLEELRAWSFDETQRPLERLAQYARQLSTRLNKVGLVVEIESSGVRIPRNACPGLWSALVHAVRNAVDHGLETASERETLSKPTHGCLRLATRWQDDDLVVSVSDDGRGIQWEAIAARAKQLGLPHETRADLESALFSERLTTRANASETSGRGVGTAALDETVRLLGGRIELESSAARGTTFRFIIPRRRIFQGGWDPLAESNDERGARSRPAPSRSASFQPRAAR